MDELITNFTTFLLGTLNEPNKTKTIYGHEIFARSLDTKPDTNTHPDKFLSKSGPWIKGYVSLSPNPVDDDVLVILGHEVVQGQKYNSPLKAFLNNRGSHVGGIDQAGHGESDGATALVTDIREWTSNTIQFMDLCVRGKYKNKQFTKFFFYGHSWGASSYMAMIFLEGKLLAKYNVLGIIMSAPYFFMEDSQFNELAFNPILNSFTPILVYGCLKYEWGQILGHLLRANVLPIWQATLANGGYRLGAMDFFAYLQTVVNTSRIIINTPDQDTKQILRRTSKFTYRFYTDKRRWITKS